MKKFIDYNKFARQNTPKVSFIRLLMTLFLCIVLGDMWGETIDYSLVSKFRAATSGGKTTNCTSYQDGYQMNDPQCVQNTANADGANAATFTSTDIIAAIVTRSDVTVSFQNDAAYPWVIENDAIKNGNCGKANSTSLLTMTYQSSVKTELSFDWRSYNSSNHSPLKLIVDGVEMDATSNSSYSNVRIYIESGRHVVVFKDEIGNSTSSSNYSYIKNIVLRQILPLETVVLTNKSQSLKFDNNGEWPWTIEDGCIQNGNYGISNSVSYFSTKFTINKKSIFSFETKVSGRDYNHELYFYINEDLWDVTSNISSFQKETFLLEPGTYTLMWVDTMKNVGSNYYSQIRNIELSSNWINVECEQAGTLGVEVLYKADVLADVELLKIKGPINSADWNTIQQMKNLVAVDMSEARFTEVPEKVFKDNSIIREVILPEGVTSIGNEAFKNTSIYGVKLPSTLETIGRDCFNMCGLIEEIRMPNSVTSVGRGAFYGCVNMSTMVFSDKLEEIESLVCGECHSLKNLHLPSKLISIKSQAFYRNQQLEVLQFPETLSKIEYEAFYNCAIKSLELPSYMSNLENYAFSECNDLKTVKLPSCVYSYNGTFNSCENIEKICCPMATPPSIEYEPFYGLDKSKVTLQVPSFAVVNYKLDSYWYEFGAIEEIDVDLDYYLLFGDLSLTNNRRMNGKPDVDLYFGGKLIVGGNAPMSMKDFYIFVDRDNSGMLINNCNAMSSESTTTVLNINGYNWHFVCPSHDVDLTKVTTDNEASFVFRYYDAQSRADEGPGNSWRNVDNGKLTAGQGYIVHSDRDINLYLPALQNSQNQIFVSNDVTKPLNTINSTVAADKNWNYIGNPYPCYYDIHYMDFTAPITVWDQDSWTYVAYSIADDEFALRPMQAFFVQKPNGVSNIVFHKEGRQFTPEINHAASVPAKLSRIMEGNRLLFNIQITDDNYQDKTRVVINEKAALDYEMECDAAKFMSLNEQVPQIFTTDSYSNKYAINERPLSDGHVKLAYYVGVPGFYTISATRADSDIYLFDTLMNKNINLQQQDYMFHSDATGGINNSRFILLFNNTGDLTDIDETAIEKNDDSAIYNLQGSKVQNVSQKGIYIQNGRKVVK